MSTEENKDVVRRALEALNKRDLGTLDQLIGGPEEWKRRLANLLTAFPDVQLIQEDQIAEGDQVGAIAMKHDLMALYPFRSAYW